MRQSRSGMILVEKCISDAGNNPVKPKILTASAW
jgi:hypothetical protein